MPCASNSPEADRPRPDPPVIPEVEAQPRLSGTSNCESNPARSRFGALLADGSHRSDRDDGWTTPPSHRQRLAFNIAAAASTLLHAGALLAFVGLLERADVGAITQASEAVSVEMIETSTLEALQPKRTSEPAPAPEATAPVEGKPEASDTPVAKADPSPEPKAVEPPPIVDADTMEEDRAARPDEAPKVEAPPEPVESPTPTEVSPEPPKAKVVDDEPPVKAKERKKTERKAAERAPRGGITSKARAGKGTGSQRVSASRGSLLSYAAHVRARVAANKPSGGGLRGTAVVAFGLTRSGGLAYARLSRSSGSATLDRLALAAVRSAAPFPTPPAGASSSQLRFSIPFYFE